MHSAALVCGWKEKRISISSVANWSNFRIYILLSYEFLVFSYSICIRKFFLNIYHTKNCFRIFMWKTAYRRNFNWTLISCNLISENIFILNLNHHQIYLNINYYFEFTEYTYTYYTRSYSLDYNCENYFFPSRFCLYNVTSCLSAGISTSLCFKDLW